MPTRIADSVPLPLVRLAAEFNLILIGVLLCGALLASADPAHSQNRAPANTVVSDRPGLGDGAWVLAPGVWQAEIGLTLQEGGTDRIGIGSALVRWGLSPLEIRFYLPSPLISVEPDGTEVGDLGLGAKVRLSAGERWRWSLVGGATLPTGSDGGTTDEATGFATLVGETSLTEVWGFTLNAGANAPFDSSDRAVLSFIPTLSASLTDAVSAYAGYAGFFQDGGDQHWLEGGIAGTVGMDVQWDLNSAYDGRNDTWFMGIGLAVRWRPD